MTTFVWDGLKVPTRTLADTVGITDETFYPSIVDYATTQFAMRIKITNNTGQTLYFKVAKNPYGSTPTRYTVTAQELGSVANGATEEFEFTGVQVTQANAPSAGEIPSASTLNETANLRVSAYLDAGYSDIYAYQDFDAPFKWINEDDAGWTVVADATGTTTSDGDVGGTTMIDANRAEATDYWNGYRLRITSGACAGQERWILSWNSANKTFTVSEAFSGQIVSGVTYNIYSGTFDYGTEQGWTATNGVITSAVYRSAPYSLLGYRAGFGPPSPTTRYLEHYKSFTIGAVSRAYAVLYYRAECHINTGIIDLAETQILIGGILKHQFYLPQEEIWFKVVVPLPLNDTNELKIKTYFSWSANTYYYQNAWLDSVKVVQS